LLVVAGEGDAWAAGEDQAVDPLLDAGREDVEGAVDVRAEVVEPAAPHSHLPRGVDHAVDPGNRLDNPVAVGEVCLEEFDPHLGEFRIIAPREAADRVPPGDELLDNVAAEESAGAGDEDMHGELTGSGKT